MYQIRKEQDLNLLELGQILMSFQTQELVQLQKYKNYYDGKHAISNRQPSDTGKPCNKVTVNYCNVIADQFAGLITSNPVTYENLDDALLDVLLYNDEILSEYDEVLHRDKFNFSDERVQALVDLVKTGIHLNRTESSEAFPDSDDRVFYEVALSQNGSYVVTGNLRHFPKSPIVVSPAQMLRIVEGVPLTP